MVYPLTESSPGTDPSRLQTKAAVLRPERAGAAAFFSSYPLPYLVLLKFRAGRAQDIADISRMLGLAEKKDLEAVREVFRNFEPEGSEDLESLIALGRLETGKQ